MRKSNDFTELSTVTCKRRGCNKALKTRLVNSKQPNNLTMCYKCYSEIRYVSTAPHFDDTKKVVINRENIASHRDACRLVK